MHSFARLPTLIVHPFAWWPTLIVVAVASFTDLRSRRIPNWLVLPFLLLGFLVSPWRPDWLGIRQGPWHGLGQSFAGFGLGILIYGILFLMGGMGAGDVKLGVAIGAWVGPMQLFWVLFWASLAGGVMALGWAIWGGFLKDMFTGAADLVFGWRQRGMHRDPDPVVAKPAKHYIPYAPAIAVGTLMSFFTH
jgi:prepilin peptidase CpaA